MLLRIDHETVYRYGYPATSSHNELRLMPFSDATQTREDFRIDVTPSSKVFSHREIGGTVLHFDIQAPHEELRIRVQSLVDTHLSNPFHAVNLLTPDADFYRSASTQAAYYEFLSPSPYVSFLPEAVDMAATFFDPSRSTAANCLALNRHLHESFQYDTESTDVTSTVETIMRSRSGVCQDFAHLMLACLRSQGVPARYVSGYLYVGNDPSMRGEQATHAWVEVLLPNGQWLGLDPTNNLAANDRYVKVHQGVDYSECTPTKGVYIGAGDVVLSVNVAVTPAAERVRL